MQIHRLSRVSPLILPLLILITARPSNAQGITIKCGDGLQDSVGVCYGSIVPGADSLQRQVLKLEITRTDQAPAGGISVRLRATSGSVHPDTQTTGPNGTVEAIWLRSGGIQPVGIAVDAHATDEAGTIIASGVRYLELKRQPPKLDTLGLRSWSGNGQSWFENNTLRNRVVFNIYDSTLPDSGHIVADSVCNAQRVVFRTVGSGSVTPDTVPGRVDPIKKGGTGCFAEARWTLGAGAGGREMRATLIPSSAYHLGANRAVTAKAAGRVLPRLVAGFVYGRDRSYNGIEEGTDTTFVVERTRVDGSTVTFDSIAEGKDAFKEYKGGWGESAFVGVTTSFPLNGWGLRPVSNHFSFTAGADLGALGSHWFAGVSLTRLPLGLALEGFPFDIHLLGHWRRRTIVENPVACEAGTAECETEKDTKFQGAAFMLTADATTVISEILKKLAP